MFDIGHAISRQLTYSLLQSAQDVAASIALDMLVGGLLDVSPEKTVEPDALTLSESLDTGFELERDLGQSGSNRPGRVTSILVTLPDLTPIGSNSVLTQSLCSNF